MKAKRPRLVFAEETMLGKQDLRERFDFATEQWFQSPFDIDLSWRLYHQRRPCLLETVTTAMAPSVYREDTVVQYPDRSAQSL